MNSFIARWCKSCDVCQKKKITRMKKETGVYSHSVGYPWKRIQIDFIGPLVRSSRGNCQILTVIEKFTKFSEAFPLPNATGELTAKTIEDEIFLRYGIPDEMLSDRGSHFICKEVKDLCLKYNVKQVFTTSYNPASNGLCERYNATLMDLLSASCSSGGREWCATVRQIVNVYNGTVQASTKMSPYELLFGFNGVLPVDKRLQHEFPDIELVSFVKDRQEALLKFRSGVKKKLLNLAEKMEKPFQHGFNVGDLVLVRNFVRSNEDKSTKFQNRFNGPFRIGDIANKAAPLVLNLDGTVFDNVNVKHLKKYHESEFPVDRSVFEPSNSDDSGDSIEPEFVPEEDVAPRDNFDDTSARRRSSRKTKRVTPTNAIPWDWLDQDTTLATPI